MSKFSHLEQFGKQASLDFPKAHYSGKLVKANDPQATPQLNIIKYGTRKKY